MAKRICYIHVGPHKTGTSSIQWWRRLCHAVREMTAVVKEIMLDPTLAVAAAWNDLQQRAGWSFKRVDCQTSPANALEERAESGG